MPAIKQVQRRAVRRHASRAIAERLKYPAGNAIISVERDPDDYAAVLLHVNSGGNALACYPALEDAGYRVESVTSHPGGYGVQLRILPTATR